FDNLFTSLEHIKAGKLRALGVATAARVQQLPDLPTVADAVPGYEASSVFGVGVPTGTPREITELLNRELDAALADPRISGCWSSRRFRFPAWQPSSVPKWLPRLKNGAG